MSEPNPFADLIVKDPRGGEAVVPGLNDRPLRAVLERFDRAAAGSLPHPLRPTEQALLIVSEQPGYGKSHLIGRLFRALHGRATLVYVQPFQNAATSFQSLMLAIVREMHFPDRAEHGAWSHSDPTQLDALAHFVLAQLLADLVGGASPFFEIDTPAETVAQLRGDPLDAFRRGEDAWGQWLLDNWAKLEGPLEEALAQRGLGLAQPGTWLRVLKTYAFHPEDFTARRVCVDWMSGQPFDREEAEALGLRAGDAMSGEISPRESNAICRTRLMDLCQLASFHRPLVLSFDQTEVYGHHPALARAFGLIVATLVHEAPGTVVVITANQSPWTQKVAPYIEEADLERILLPPLTLDGINRAQATELARLRLQAAGADPARLMPFLAGPWMNEMFPAPTSQIGARRFLQICQQRWENAPTRELTLQEHYERQCAEILKSPKRLVFNPDALQWLIEVAACGLPGVQVLSLEERYFSVQWTTPQRICLFGFVPGSHWKQWRTIARISSERNRVSDPPTKCVFFRAPDDAPIPGAHWQVRDEIDAAKRESLHLIKLTNDDLSTLYAARELFADAVQGDIAYTSDEVLQFLHERLRSWWDRLQGPVEGAVAAPVAQPVFA
jgi:hypothetical protein